MDYKDRYNRLLDAINELQEANPSDEGIQNWVKDNVPELKLSEDERIREALIRFHKSTIDIDGIKGEDIIAWLEKQGEQKSDDNVETKFKAGDWVVFANGNVGRITSAGTEWQKQQEYKDSELKLMNEHDKAKKFIFELCRVYDITDSNGYAVDSKSLISEFESYMKGE